MQLLQRRLSGPSFGCFRFKSNWTRGNQARTRATPRNNPTHQTHKHNLQDSQLPSLTHLTRIAVAYAVLVNAGSFALFAHDKHMAQTHGWRIPEKTLQATALMGGWVGGVLAMVRKPSIPFPSKHKPPDYLLPRPCLHSKNCDTRLSSGHSKSRTFQPQPSISSVLEGLSLHGVCPRASELPL